MAQVGADAVLVAVHSRSGAPCNPGGQPTSQAAVVSGQPALLARALEIASRSAQSSGTTCILSPTGQRTCRHGQGWKVQYCYPGRRAVSEWWTGTEWERLERKVGRRTTRCPRSAPYLISFSYDQDPGWVVARVVVPRQPGVGVAKSDQYSIVHVP